MSEIIITISSSNLNTLVFHASEGTKLSEVLNEESVRAFFNGASYDALVEALEEFKGADTSDNDNLKAALLAAAVSDGDEVVIGLEAIEPETDTEDCSAEQPQAFGRITVVAGRGAEKVSYDIELGITTLRDVLYSERVKARVGMTDAQVSACAVTAYGSDEPSIQESGISATQADLDDRTFLKDGMSLWLTPKTAHDKGC